MSDAKSEDGTTCEQEDGKPYVIQPRDTLLTIALMHEVDADDIAAHEKNAEIFKEKKRDPHMLAPGEILFVPQPKPPTPSRPKPVLPHKSRRGSMAEKNPEKCPKQM